MRWSERIRASREALSVTRGELAERLGIPRDSLRRWEDGTRRPREAKLRALLDELKLTGAEANAILADAGYRPEPTLFPNWRYPNYFYTAEELQAAVELVPWPEFVLDNNVAVVAANAAAQAVWCIDFAEERHKRSRAQMSLLSVASDNRFADKLVNWDECVRVIAGVFKGQPSRPESLDEPSAYLNEVLKEFAAGDPQFLRRLIHAFAEAEPEEAKVRGQYPVVWRDDEYGEMRFLALRTTASEPNGYGFQDWIPRDAETWLALEQVKARSRR